MSVSFVFFFSSRRRHTRSLCDWSSDVCSSDLSGGGSGVRLAAPVDVRIGFLSRSQNMFEGRVSLLWDSNSGFVAFSPGVNILHQLKRGTGTHGLMRATYVTGGVGLNITKAGSGADRKSTRLNSSHTAISYAVLCLKKKNTVLYHLHPAKVKRTAAKVS